MDVYLTLLVDARCVMKDILCFIILVSCPTVSYQAMENVLNVILTMYSSQTVLVSQKTSSVKKWMNSELASSVWIATTTLRNTKNVSRKNQVVFITKWENAPLVMNLSSIIMANAELKDV